MLQVKSLIRRFLVRIGNFLIRQTVIEPADYIVLLNGSVYDRAREAADLYSNKLGKKILLQQSCSPCGYDDIRKLGIVLLNDCQINAAILNKLGVPQSDLETTKKKSFGTYDEALATRDHLKEASARSIILVTSCFHSKRAYYIFRKVLGDLPVKLMCQPTRYDHIDMSNWWTVGWQRKWIFWEYLKLVYYTIRY